MGVELGGKMRGGTGGGLRQWAVMPGPSFRMCDRTVDILPPGAYACLRDTFGNCRLEPHPLVADDLIDFPDSLANRLVAEIEQFWTSGGLFREHGFLHRRGYLLHGRQGSGKSSLVNLVVTRAVEQGRVAFFCGNPEAFAQGVAEFRETEPHRPALCIFEDLDAIIRCYGEGRLLQWLDGNQQVDRVVNVATTNYLERLDKRIRCRPRRFDRVVPIEWPAAPLRAAYFARRIPRQAEDERRRWVELTDGLSFAAMAELIISVRCLGKDLEKTTELLRSLEHEDAPAEAGEGEEEDPLLLDSTPAPQSDWTLF